MCTGFRGSDEKIVLAIKGKAFRLIVVYVLNVHGAGVSIISSIRSDCDIVKTGHFSV